MSFSDLIKVKVSREALQKGNCQRCSLKDGGFVPADLKENSKVLVVGEAPGEQEVKQGKPFVGKSGQLLRKVIQAAGFDLEEEVSISNIAKCRPPSNRDPTDKERNACTRIFLDRELQVDQSPLVILAGSIAASHFFPDIKNQITRGNFLVRKGRTFLHTHHPMRCLYDETKLPEFEKDIQKAKAYLDGTLFANRKYIGVETQDTIGEFIDACKGKDVVSVDVEGDERVLYCVGFSPEKNVSYCLPTEHADFEDVQFRRQLREAVQTVLNSVGELVLQNAKYDLRVLRAKGFEIKSPINDIMFESFLYDETKRTNSLKFQVAKHLDGYSNIITDFRNPPWKSLMWYNCEDTDYTRQLRFVYEDLLTKGQKWVLRNSMLPALLCLMRLEENGCKIDVEHARKLWQELESDKIRIRSEINRIHEEFVGVNIGSPKQLSDVLFDKLRYKSVAKTAGGAPQLDEHALQTMRDEQGCDVADRILKYRSLGKKQGTYIKGMLERLGSDGRIHSNYSQIVAVTGRLSSSNPNLQNIDTDPRIRNMFVASDGHKLVDLDFAQQELRIAASLANERTMIDIFNSGGDIHRETAGVITGKNPEDVTKEERYKGKPANFGLIYGQAAEGYQQYVKSEYGVDISMAEAEFQHASFFKKYSGLPLWHQAVKSKVLKEGVSVSPFGRIRHLPDAFTPDPQRQSRAVRQGINFPVQGAGSEVALIAMARGEKMLVALKIRYRMVLQVHDNFIGEVPDECVEDYIAVFRDVARDLQFDWLKVPLLVDFKVGERWGSLKELE